MKNSVPLIYRLLLLLFSPVIFVYLLNYAYRRGGGIRYFNQRLARYKQPPSTRIAWLHAASVGEVNAAVPLLELLIKQYPETEWLITTNTVTGARSVEQKLGEKVHHCYLPIDYSFAVSRFLNTYRPCCALVMETELWPNLYNACAKLNIPIALINARLSKRTLNMPACLHKSARQCLQQLSIILARGEQDAAGYQKLGADSNKIKVVGNIKYAAHADIRLSESKSDFDRPFVLAASTHDDEEKQLAELWKSLNIKTHLLVLAPRYPDRRQAVLDDIGRAGLKAAVHSLKEAVSDETDIYLVDTLGELSGFIANAELVFMGGSLVPRGGQNVLEPAKLGKAIITGPHSFTFTEDIEALSKADAIVCIDTVEELKNTIRELIENPQRAQELGNNASKFMQARADVAQHYLEEIKILGWLENK